MRTGEEECEPKAEVVREICSISAIFTSCSHLSSNVRKPAFVDWYLILRVDEDSGLDVIRRRYRQLALQIHPDKNWHPKAEVAFKLVSERAADLADVAAPYWRRIGSGGWDQWEPYVTSTASVCRTVFPWAHECLSDKSRRKAFDSGRRKRFCKECHLKFERSSSSSSSSSNGLPQSKQQQQQQQCSRVVRSFREVQNRLKEEGRVIEKCLRANNNESVGKAESPLFDPSDRLLFPGYPHTRTRVLAERQWSTTTTTTTTTHRRFRYCEPSPAYQLRPESRSCTPGCRS